MNKLLEQINSVNELMNELKAKEPLLNETERGILQQQLSVFIERIENFIMNWG